MQRHEFTDFNSLLQLIAGQTTTEYMNMESSYDFDRVATNRYVYMVIFLGDKKFYHQRNVYDYMAFLGDLGGIAESMFFIGIFVHFCFT